MHHVLIIGSGLSGLACALELAQQGITATLASPYPSERAQSVMAAGGINAALAGDDSVDLHARDTLHSGGDLADPEAVRAMCEAAPELLTWLEQLGVEFSRDEAGQLALRAFGGQSRKRTAYAGASTGKQLMTALIRKARAYEAQGLIRRLLGRQFHSALIQSNTCYGALLYNERTRQLEPVWADAVVAASGGQNVLFGKTTGSMHCDGYVTAKLYQQGAKLKNLEFIQYHPTTLETPQKRMLISEAARGEGGRLYYLDGEKRVYFLEDKYGEKGNLMPRDIVSKCIYDAPSQVYLDISFLDRSLIGSRLGEVAQLCRTYAGLDVTRESIPVAPSVHFFMGGLWVDREHRTSVDRLYAVGECASMYHGANRLGGNSLLAALYGGRVAARSVAQLGAGESCPDLQSYIDQCRQTLSVQLASQSPFSAVYVRQEVAKLLRDCLGITRTQEKLVEGIKGVDYYLSICDKLFFDPDVTPYMAYSLGPMLLLARAILTSALERRETRGAHIRRDFPDRRAEFDLCSLCQYRDGQHHITYAKEGAV